MRRTKQIIAKLMSSLLLLGVSFFSQAYDCSDLDEYSPPSTVSGSIIQNNGHAYRCDVGGWCQISGPYEPGIGWAWRTAWTDLGECEDESNQAPSIAFDIPHTVANGTEVDLKAVFEDSDGIVQKMWLYIDGELKGSTQALYGIPDMSYLWTATTGYHSVRYDIEDDLGAQTSATMTIKVTENLAPEVGIYIPGSSVTYDTLFEVAASASDRDGTVSEWSLTVYDYTLDGPQNPLPVASGVHGYPNLNMTGTLPAGTLPLGSYILVAEVLDDQGATGRDTRVFEVMTATPTPTPTVTPVPTPTIWPSPTPTNSPVPTLYVSGPTSVELPSVASFTVSVSNLPELNDIIFTFDGKAIEPRNIGISGAPPTYGINAEFIVIPELPGFYSIDIEIEIANGETLSDSRELEVIYACNTGGAEPWDSDKVYTSGDLVFVDYTVYLAQFWTRGDNPQTTNSPWGPWTLHGYLNCI